MNDETLPAQPNLRHHGREGDKPSGHPSLAELIASRFSRRGALRVGVGSAATAVLAACRGGAVVPDAKAGPGAPEPAAARLDFAAVAKNVEDRVTVPAGYTASVLYALGDPLDARTPAFRNDGTDGDFERRAGDHHDGMAYFGLDGQGTAPLASGSQRALLVVNHEATSHSGGEIASTFLHADGGTNTLPRPAAEVDKEIAIHGVSVVEVRRTASGFAYQPDSRFNRRVTPLTPMRISGPARGSALMVTKFSHDGTQCRGTLSNCGTGQTPWGTFLTGEENWAGYFRRAPGDDALRADKSVASLRRYGHLEGAASRHGWESAGTTDRYARWDISQTGADATQDWRNELNTFGFIVEMDPYDGTQALRKRTALGRFAHESAVFGLVRPNRPLAVYMGDDARGEYIYKFVSDAPWNPADAAPANRITTGDKYLDSGKLYVARFDADGSGEWIELSARHPAIAAYAGYPFADEPDVLVNARLAADAVGATRLDRPEWCAVHPATGEIYCTLTNNSSRKVEPADVSHMAVDAANPRAYRDSFGGGGLRPPGNINGHILRLKENGDDSSARGFQWDVYLYGAEAGADPARVNLSQLTADQDFSSPDGLWFSARTGLCFIQTDDRAYTDVSNCMMLAAIPGRVGDGEARTLDYTRADGGTARIEARVGARPTAASLRRFLVGPVDCEITGICETPDGRAIFVNIQHPGASIRQSQVGDPARYRSHWPANAGYGAGQRPRSATIVITRDDGGLIGADHGLSG